MPAFTRKHYVTIARIISEEDEDTRNRLVAKFSEVFREDNPRFNAQVFAGAAGANAAAYPYEGERFETER